MRTEMPPHTLSISARLTLFYSIAILLATALFACVIYWRLEANFATEHARFLEAKIAELKEDFSDGHGRPQALLSEIAKETAGTRLREYEARLLSDARVLGETPDMGIELPITVFPPEASAQEAISRVRSIAVAHHRFLLTSVVLAGPPAANGLELQIALDVTRDTALLAAFRDAMIVTFLVLAPILVLTGLWIAARGLAPLWRIAEAAQGVTPSRLAERIAMTPPWPRELAGLVATFNAMLDRLEEAFGRLSRFSADLAHELRTPLGNLIGEIEVSLRRQRSPEEYRATLESNLEECRRLGALIENLLFLARAEQAEITLHKGCVSGREICDQAMARLNAAADPRGIHIIIEGDADIHADPALLRQALTNLLGNAVRHSPDGAPIHVHLRKDDDGIATVAVHNDGPPIATEHLPRLFDRFYQVAPSRTHGAGQGTGLGLSIVQSIMVLHGGAAMIESAGGAGTTATLSFPAEEAPKA